MKRTMTLFSALALVVTAVLAATPRSADACWSCDWNFGCVSDMQGQAGCITYPIPRGGYICEMDATPCGGWTQVDRAGIAPDGTLVPGSYEAAVLLAGGGSMEPAGADAVRVCDGVLLARAYTPKEAEQLREASRRILI